MTIRLEPMQVLESDCPFHKDELTRVVKIGGIASWLREQGYLDENDDPIGVTLESPIRGVDAIAFRIWDEGVTEIGEIEYRCRFGCRLNAFALEGGDWAANGQEIRVNDLMDFFPGLDHITKEEWEADNG